jgi:hypothetical protein
MTRPLEERAGERIPRIEIRALNRCNLDICKCLIINAAIPRFMGRRPFVALAQF